MKLKKVGLMARKSCINFLLATKMFIPFIFHEVIFDVVIEPNPNLCILNRAFIFKKRIKRKSFTNVDSFSLSKLVAEEICQHVSSHDRTTIRPGVYPHLRLSCNQQVFTELIVFTVSLILIRTEKKIPRIKINTFVSKEKKIKFGP